MHSYAHSVIWLVLAILYTQSYSYPRIVIGRSASSTKRTSNSNSNLNPTPSVSVSASISGSGSASASESMSIVDGIVNDSGRNVPTSGLLVTRASVFYTAVVVFGVSVFIMLL